MDILCYVSKRGFIVNVSGREVCHWFGGLMARARRRYTRERIPYPFS